MLQHAASHCISLQHTVTTLQQHAAANCNTQQQAMQQTATPGKTLQQTATHGNTR